jgi:hypothetical protein
VGGEIDDEKCGKGGLLVIVALIGFFAVLAKSASGAAQTAYIAAITGLLGSMGGLVGGTAIGTKRAKLPPSKCSKKSRRPSRA